MKKICMFYFHTILLSLIVRKKSYKTSVTYSPENLLCKNSETCRDQNAFVFEQLVKSKIPIPEPKNTRLKFLVMLPRKQAKKLVWLRKNWDASYFRANNAKNYFSQYLFFDRHSLAIASTTVKNQMRWWKLSH